MQIDAEAGADSGVDDRQAVPHPNSRLQNREVAVEAVSRAGPGATLKRGLSWLLVSSRSNGCLVRLAAQGHPPQAVARHHSISVVAVHSACAIVTSPTRRCCRGQLTSALRSIQAYRRAKCLQPASAQPVSRRATQPPLLLCRESAFHRLSARSDT